MERRLARPGFWMAALMVLLTLIFQVILAVPLGIIDVVFIQVLHRPSPGLEQQPFVIGCINILAIGATIAVGLHLNRLPFRRAFPLDRIKAGHVLALAIAILGASVVLSEADNLFRAVLPPPRLIANLMENVFLRQDSLFSRIFLMVIVAPVTEELLFRGIILRGLLSRYRPAVAVVLTSVLFTALHVNPWQSVSAFWLGILFGWVFLRTGLVWLCVLAHAMANGLVIIFALLPLSIPGMTAPPGPGVVEFQPWWLDLLGLGVLAAGLWAFYRATPKVEAVRETPPPSLPPVVEEPL